MNNVPLVPKTKSAPAICCVRLDKDCMPSSYPRKHPIADRRRLRPLAAEGFATAIVTSFVASVSSGSSRIDFGLLYFAIAPVELRAFASEVGQELLVLNRWRPAK